MTTSSRAPASSRVALTRTRPATAWRWVLPAAVAQAVVLTAGSRGYGWHRDELYFRMLPSAWGHVDQPPLVPFLARSVAGLVDEPWALRVPATLASAVSVVLVALIARALGGGRGAQALAAWGYAFAAMPLMLGHLLLTSTLDQSFWLAATLATVLAVRGDPRWWLAAGAVAGAASYSRLLVAVLGVALAVGVLVLGPRRVLRSPWLWAGAALAALLSAPNLAYQATHDWPQLAMGAALAENNAGEVRALALPLLLVMLGPVLAVVWGVGVAWLLRRPQRCEVGFLAVAFGVLVAFTLLSGAQPHYPVHLLSAMYAAGCVPVARWLSARTGWRRLALAGLAANAAFAVVLALPAVPAERLGDTPVPDIGPLAGDQVGWPVYVAQVADAVRGVPEGHRVAVITSNYGEAGALARFGPAHGLPAPHSGHNALHDAGPPADETDTVVLVGWQAPHLTGLFGTCRTVDRLDNGVGVDNEEQGAPVMVCAHPAAPWRELWPRFRHLD
ncbi:glycosyltransferase family 39 protein [Knoellia sp. p5-6-4]|uniref:glycosyltransferase family 39 protein n=1 Tax=unclassified Knoellia TaxID=2618719 RepID=UPI0023DA7E8F|nr:glycosyltransferase family 39 protein [Knoellia sp. p5-6-4]MDF2146103.1 glycosyltransferase family 39 protein [Knoellia sp. p5-6-4]